MRAYLDHRMMRRAQPSTVMRELAGKSLNFKDAQGPPAAERGVPLNGSRRSKSGAGVQVFARDHQWLEILCFKRLI
jgi:hypothetical protein